MTRFTLITLLSLVSVTVNSSGDTGDSRVQPCIYDGHLKTERDWYGFIANISILTRGRLTFEFTYPENKCCQNILFYTEAQLSQINDRMSCRTKESAAQEEDGAVLRLTPNYAWSGCDITYPNGVPTVLCVGGKRFTSSRATRWYLAVSNCDTLGGLDLKYHIEVYDHDGQCPDSSGDESNAKVRRKSRDESMANAGGESGDICLIEGNVNTPENWFGFLANISIVAEGGFYYKISFPYSLKTLDVVLYSEEDLTMLEQLDWNEPCRKKNSVVEYLEGQQYVEQILLMHEHASWHGCAIENFSDGTKNLTCQGMKKFPNRPRKFYMSVSDCWSNTGLQAQYTLEIFGFQPGSCTSGVIIPGEP